MPNVVTISGTSRPDNFTSRALALVNDELTREGSTPSVFDARELELAFPGFPATPDAERLREAVSDASGIVIATPEYHGSFSAMTKLIIENMGFPSPLSGKPVAMLGVAAGRIGAIKSLEQLRCVLSHTGALVVPSSVSVAGVRGVFHEDGGIDEGSEQAIRGLARSLLDFMRDYVQPKQVLEEMVRNGAAPWTTRV